MKKLMLAMAVVVGAVSAQAATTYSYSAMAKPSAVSSWASTDMPYTHIYGLSAEEASAIVGQTLTKGKMDNGTAGAAMCNTIANYIKNNYSVAKAGWAAGGNEFTYKDGKGVDTGKPGLTSKGYVNATLELEGTIANTWQNLQYIVTFYDGSKVGEGNGAFRVLVLCDATTTLSGHHDGVQWGVYTTTTIPEPTSGLLMLLGVAGLALKRKRA